MKSINQILNYLIALTVVAAGAIYFFLQENSTSPKTDQAIKVPEKTKVEQVVNKYMRQVGDQAKLAEIRAKRQLEELEKKVEADKIKQKLQAEKKLQEIPIENQIYKAKSDATQDGQSAESVRNTGEEEADSQASLAVGPDGEIDVKNMTVEQKKEYIRQYKENARRGGYLIELNDNLEVIKATPIRKPSQQNDIIESYQSD